MKRIILIILLTIPMVCTAQIAALKTNLIYAGATLTPNLGLEIGLGKKTSLEIIGAYNPWNLDGTNNNNKKFVHWIAQAEARLWLCQRFSGHYFGLHAFGGQFNVAGHQLPFVPNSEKYRFEGGLYGAGVSYGYQWVFAKRWSLEATVGVGYARIAYDRYDCVKCGNQNAENRFKNYFGPTKLGLSLVFIIK